MTDNKKPHTAGTGTASKTAFNDPHSTKTDRKPPANPGQAGI
jgi:hypothetical protein